MSDSSANQGPNKKLLWIIAAVGVAMFLFGKYTDRKTEAEAPNQQRPVAIEAGPAGINQITGQDKDAALTQFRKQLEAMQAETNRTVVERIKADKARDQQMREMQQQNNAQSRALSEKIAEMQKKGVEDLYNAINQKDKSANNLSGITGANNLNIPSGGLSFDGDLDLGPPIGPSAAPVPKHPFGPNYFVLKPETQAQTTFQGKSGGGQVSPSEASLFNDMSSPSGTGQNSKNGGSLDQQFNDVYGTQGNSQGNPASQNANTAVAAQPTAMTADEARVKKMAADTYEINAFSFVEVTTLHGVACPIGANSPGASDSAKIPARPIVLPVHGIFKGPNGVERDLGTIHLMGLCSGLRTSSSSTGRANIRVEQLSYWDALGGPQMVAATGYIVDTRDNEADVYGKLDKASGRTLALQAAAAAAAAYATTLSSAEFTNTSASQNGTTSATSQLTGDATKAAVSQGIGSMFQKISERFKAEADAAIDTILVEPGIRLRFVTDQPIRVVKPLEPFDIDASMYDTLI
ncbi:conjugal transfer protein TraB [Pseudomonas violetae]|uniref:Conjugal transfer protein TraB n=1 Tax=Pseudomonas violetae TaxID=2915813 RepID=A0ABT0ETW8_9PSED|nr:conjugal transfer protein TraB [Pseudomonas violetae]MCK1788906.1 conjugal transfer protein TraB [Pseudomonas violetae]